MVGTVVLKEMTVSFKIRSVIRPRTSPANTAIAYLRVSTEEQAESGAGLDAQRATIAAEADRRGWTITAWYVDAGASGKSMTNRPELAKALADVRERRAASLVVAKLDRLSRSLLDFAALMADAQRSGWNLVALDLGLDLSTPSGEMMAGVMAVYAQFERRIIGQRTRDGLAAKRAAGVRLGAPRTAADDVLRAAVNAYRDTSSWSAAARALTESAVPTPTGRGRWYPASVRHLVMSQDGQVLMTTSEPRTGATP